MHDNQNTILSIVGGGAMKVVLVDDERIAIEHIRSLIPWAEHGYEIAATATNGKSALRICEEQRPHIMIVDIRMPVMDGLELIRTVSDKRLGVKFIVMSAYEDFEYARQAISLGNVSSYLVKHEVDGEKLLRELDKAKEAWTVDERLRRSRFNEQIGDALTGRYRSGTDPDVCLKPPFGVMLIQADVPFSAVPRLALHSQWTGPVKWDLEVSSFAACHPVWQCTGEFPVGGSQYAALFALRNRTCRPMKDTFRELGSEVRAELIRRHDRSFSVYYTIQPNEGRPLSLAYVQAGRAAFHAVFCGRGILQCTDDLPLADESGNGSQRQIRFEALSEGMRHNRADEMEAAIRMMFEAVCRPCWDMRGLYALIGGLNGLLHDFRTKLGLPILDPLDPLTGGPLYHIDEIKNRYVRLFAESAADSPAAGTISGKLVKALRFIHEQYDQDICIDDVSHATGCSASYLHQAFKRELHRTFLDYLTKFRVEQAKRILRTDNAKMADVASRVGYRSPQHFSQVFKKTTGTLPHQYRDGGGWE